MPVMVEMPGQAPAAEPTTIPFCLRPRVIQIFLAVVRFLFELLIMILWLPSGAKVNPRNMALAAARGCVYLVVSGLGYTLVLTIKSQGDPEQTTWITSTVSDALGVPERNCQPLVRTKRGALDFLFTEPDDVKIVPEILNPVLDPTLMTPEMLTSLPPVTTAESFFTTPQALDTAPEPVSSIQNLVTSADLGKASQQLDGLWGAKPTPAVTATTSTGSARATSSPKTSDSPSASPPSLLQEFLLSTTPSIPTTPLAVTTASDRVSQPVHHLLTKEALKNKTKDVEKLTAALEIKKASVPNKETTEATSDSLPKSVAIANPGILDASTDSPQLSQKKKEDLNVSKPTLIPAPYDLVAVASAGLLLAIICLVTGGCCGAKRRQHQLSMTEAALNQPTLKRVQSFGRKKTENLAEMPAIDLNSTM